MTSKGLFCSCESQLSQYVFNFPTEEPLTAFSYDYTGSKHELFRSIILRLKFPHEVCFHLFNSYILRASYMVGTAPCTKSASVSKVGTVPALL